MGKTAIIHISDLHVSNDPSISNLNTGNTDKVKGYQDLLVKYKRDSLKYDSIYLIISGDIANSADVNEYDFAKDFIDKLEIRNENILIIPGNHDVNWNDNRKAYSKAIVENDGVLIGLREAFQFQNEKFEKFSVFYRKLYNSKKHFNPKNVIVNTLNIPENKLLIIGLNSCYKCNHTKDCGVGYIDASLLDAELNQLMTDEYEHYVKIAICHHNPQANYSEAVKNGFENNNWQRVKTILETHGISTILFGHEHTPGTDEVNVFYYSAVGSLSKTELSNVFNVIEIDNEEDSLVLNIKHHSRQDPKNNSHPDGYWSFISESPFNKVMKYKAKPKKNIIEVSPLLPKSTKEVFKDKSIKPQAKLALSHDHVKNKFADEIFERVKTLKLFKSGHFHWSDTSRAHNWIDIPKLLNEKNDIFLVQKSIIQAIVDNDIQFDLIIGLGIEGNIIASRCAADHLNIPYTFLPYSYRYEDHAQYEKELKLTSNNFHKVLIITDVVHEGTTIKKILVDEHSFFDNNREISEINVISLFFTGENYSIDMLNDELEKRFKFYYVSKIRVEECPYRNDPDWATNCDLFCHKLDKVYEFYNRPTND